MPSITGQFQRRWWLRASALACLLTEHAMPRYFFHILNGRAIIDAVGVELPGLREARQMAIKTAGEVLASEGDAFWSGGRWRMSIADETGKIHLSLDISAESAELD